MQNLILKILIALGFRSRCCGAPTIFFDNGYDQTYCSQCRNRLS